MSIGEYAGVALQDANDKWRHGAVFLLQKAAERCEPVSLNGWTTAVAGGERAVIVCGPSSATDPADVLTEALEAANTGLDYLSGTGRTHSRIVQASDDHILWWPDGGGKAIMRATLVHSMSLPVPQFVGVVTRPDGTVPRPPPPPTAVAHDALRFMRIAKTSDDMFDACRNLFLALESLLDGLHPHASGGEGAWFKAALSAADPLVPVAQLAPPNEADPIGWIYTNIYVAQRSALMHAKQKRGYLRPHESASQVNLAASLPNLWRYVSDLVATQLHVESGSGHWSGAGWAEASDVVLKVLALFASEDGSQFVHDGRPNPLDPAVTTVHATPTAPVTDPSDPMLRTISASFDPGTLRALDIRKLGALGTGGILDGQGIFAESELTGPLRVGKDVSRFEMIIGLRNFSTNGAPKVFSS